MWDHFPFVWNHSPAATMRSRSMTSDSWPNGVATESDNCKFLNLLFANAPRKDLTKSQDASGIIKACFLTFVRGIHDVNDLKMIEVSFNLFPDQQKWEAVNGHMFQVADRIHDVTGSNKKARYYRQATLNGNNCDCRISFGRDDKWKKATCPRAANAHLHGQIVENCLMKNMKKNHEDLFPQETALPQWLKSGTFHVLFNKYNHLGGNSIDFHDDGGETYSFLDPICSFRFKSPEFFWSSASLGPRKARRRRLTKHPFFCCFRILAIVWSFLVTSSSSTCMLFLPEINGLTSAKAGSTREFRFAVMTSTGRGFVISWPTCRRVQNLPTRHGLCDGTALSGGIAITLAAAGMLWEISLQSRGLRDGLGLGLWQSKCLQWLRGVLTLNFFFSFRGRSAAARASAGSFK